MLKYFRSKREIMKTSDFLGNKEIKSVIKNFNIDTERI